jgi:glycerol-3-phosphate O-acyltransferase
LQAAPGSKNNNKASRENLSPWPESCDGAIVFLLDARDHFEDRLLRKWVESSKPDAAELPPYSFVDLDKGATRELLAAAARQETAWMQPLRIAWLPSKKAGRTRSLQDLFHGRITEPGRLRRWWLAKHRPERMAYVLGEGAHLHTLRERLTGGNGSPAGISLSAFVTSQALIALERAERTIRGARYKISRILDSEVFANREFRNLIANSAQELDRSVPDVLEQASRYLHEMAAMQTPFTLDVMTALYRAACRSHHDEEIDVNDEQLERVARTLADRPVVFLISHKSMLDTVALSLVLFDANQPLPLTFGGINLDKPGVGALARRAGIIFLRRSFQDNEIYKATFRRYIDYLIEKRFSLLWALEGTRSRTGKLLAPRFGLFSYVVESILRTRLFDVTFIPVSVAYDQITEVEDYSIEQRGQRKKPEGITWPLRFLRRGRSRGRIHVRFGEGLTIRDLIEPEQLEKGIDDQRKRMLVPTLAFEVAVRMNAATPITATSIVTLILLAGGNRAQSLTEIQSLARAGAALIRQRHLEIVGRSNFRDDDALRATLEELHETGIVNYLDEGTERLYAISPDQHLNAAYYRNTAIHYFILDAFVEVALLEAAEAEDPVATFHATTRDLRELFKFEFYLPRRANYRSEIEQRAEERFGDWQIAVQEDKGALLSRVQLLVAHGVLRSFVEAYRVFAGVLAEAGDDAVDDRAALVSKCMKTGKQQLLQGRVVTPESISKTLYETGLRLADYRGLLSANRSESRRAFHQELRGINKRLDEILAITLAKAEEAAN